MSRCRNCYTYGHNKRTCPDLTQRYRDRYDYAVRHNESEASIDHAAQSLIERTGIDPRTVQDIQTIARDLRAKGLSILITDHNALETLQITDRAYIMVDGRILTSGTARELTEDEDVRRLYLGERFRLS